MNFKDDEEHDLILAVAKQLNVKTSVEMETIRAILFPSILCAAVFTGDFLLLCHEKTDFDTECFFPECFAPETSYVTYVPVKLLKS